MFPYPMRRLILRSGSRRIRVWNCAIALKFDMHLGSDALEALKKFRSDTIIFIIIIFYSYRKKSSSYNNTTKQTHTHTKYNDKRRLNHTHAQKV